jgi:cytochrome c biogenesis protein CcmG, thiol:disulfide interchange protein DsbE
MEEGRRKKENGRRTEENARVSAFRLQSSVFCLPSSVFRLSSSLFRPFKPALVITALLAVASIQASGRTAPSLKLRAIDGSTVELKSFKGKIVLVDFWASWCLPCKAVFPALNDLHEELQATGVEVLAINVDEKRRNADAFLAGTPHTLRVLLDPRMTAADAFRVRQIPTAYVIDRKGIIRYTHEGYSVEAVETFRKEVAALLAETTIANP